MLLCPISRSQLLAFLPKGGEVAEIGVAEGDFSAQILAVAAPRRLHLIDPWEHQDRADYAKDNNNVPDAVQDARHDAVLGRFSNEIGRGTVQVHRDYAEDALVFFAEAQLDWIYVDGMHTADAVYRDLTTYQHKVKPDGLIAGHDYTNHVQARSWGFGVVEGVNRYVRESGCEFVAMTMEGFPTYVLARIPGGAAAARLRQALIENVPYLVEIRDYPGARGFEHKSLPLDKGLIVYPSF